MHGQIWRHDPHAGDWTLAYRAPDEPGRSGSPVPRDLGYRGMTVFQGHSDPGPTLYVGAISTVLRGKAARLLRSTDGASFEPVGDPGLGNPKISTLRAMTGFDGHLYVPPAGEGITLNSNSASVIMRSPDPAVGLWEQCCPPGFGNPDNTGVFELCVFADHLYAGTFNRNGYEVWKTPANGGGPCRWARVLEEGADRGPHNQIAMSMCVFEDALYVGSAIQNGGYDRVHGIGPAAAELVRLYPDDTWDLVVGEPRGTPNGFKRPLSGLGPGFDNLFSGYVWRLTVHDGWLYASTFDWSVFLPYAHAPSYGARRLADEFGVDEVVSRGSGFELWRSDDGITWLPVTTNGFDNPYNYGARTLLSTPHGLYVGTANPFSPKVAARLAHGWAYVDNPHGGAEVHLGRAASANGRIHHAHKRTRTRLFGGKAAQRTSSVLLTGATGFIGSHVLDLLRTSGSHVRALAVPGTADHLRDTEVDVIVGTLGDGDALKAAVRDVDVVCHLAALLPSAAPAKLQEVNVLGTQRLLQACCGSDSLRRFVLMSSTAVYAGAFEPAEWPLTEDSMLGPRAEEVRSYGWTKIAAERLLAAAELDRGVQRTVIRSTTAYGVGAPRSRDLLQNLLDTPSGVGRGHVLQFVQVDDLARAVRSAVLDESWADRTIHVAGPDAITWAAAAGLVQSIAGRNTPHPRVPGLARYRYPYDTTRLRSLGFVASTGMREGLRNTTAWYLDQDHKFDDIDERVHLPAPHRFNRHSRW